MVSGQWSVVSISVCLCCMMRATRYHLLDYVSQSAGSVVMRLRCASDPWDYHVPPLTTNNKVDIHRFSEIKPMLV